MSWNPGFSVPYPDDPAAEGGGPSDAQDQLDALDSRVDDLESNPSGDPMSDSEGAMYSGMDNRHRFALEYGDDEGYDEEFDGLATASLPADWVWVNQDTATYEQAFGQGRIVFVTVGGDDSNLHAVVRPLPATTTFDAFMHLTPSNMFTTAGAEHLCEMVLWNSSTGRAVLVVLHHNTGSLTASPAPVWYVTRFNTVDDFGSVVQTGPVQRPEGGQHAYIRLTKQADDNYDVYGNINGGAWNTIGVNLDLNGELQGEPTHIGFGLNMQGSGHVGCEWFRLRGVT